MQNRERVCPDSRDHRPVAGGAGRHEVKNRSGAYHRPPPRPWLALSGVRRVVRAAQSPAGEAVAAPLFTWRATTAMISAISNM
jgi:hypothetical protein